MENNPLIDPYRNAGQAYVDSFKGDWDALVADLRRRSQKEKRKVISRTSRRARNRAMTTKSG